MTLSEKDEWLESVVAANAQMNAVIRIVQGLNELHEAYRGDLAFYIEEDGRLAFNHMG